MISVLFFYGSLFASFVLSIRYTAVYAFVAYQLVYFFNPEKRWWGYQVPDISYSFFTVLWMGLLLCLGYSKYKSNTLLTSPPLKWAYTVCALYLLAYTYAIFPEPHYDFMIYFLKLMIIISIAYKLINSRKDLTLALYGYVAGAWYVSFYVFQIGRNAGDRVEGVGLVDSPDANGLAAAIAPSLVLCLYYYWIHKPVYLKVLFALAGIFIANAIVLINSRGAFLGVAISLAFFMYYMYTSSFQRKYQKGTAIFITICGLAGGVYLADDGFIERMSTIKEEKNVNYEKESGGTRMLFWQAAWDMAKDHPFGNGYRGFNFYAPLYLPDNVDTGNKRSRSVHSTWFETLSEVGYAGLIAFILMLWTAWRALSQTKEHLRQLKEVDPYFKMIAIQASMVCFAVCMTFLNRMRAEILYWIILFAASAYNVYVLKDAANKKGSQPPPVSKESSS